ncbi:hypothetical protein FB566_1383 [Stackebrandtia endophytica]|uniref:Uncharacterized protein n=1 Tax=Stackebrandtia endophytica TaxID=1496996 RepID=A0A543ATH2_9ACTN|nr:hypothetical protein [Stackebrandtia endophytica]TQL75868.1 hypothetical protein FB566_1383 [Stackebrandtia endophytica]
MGGIGRLTDVGGEQPVAEPRRGTLVGGDSEGMNVITTVLTVVGVVIGAGFLLGGGVLLPLWEQLETRGERNGADK